MGSYQVAEKYALGRGRDKICRCCNEGSIEFLRYELYGTNRWASEQIFV
jgi:hypothetical protein